MKFPPRFFVDKASTPDGNLYAIRVATAVVLALGLCLTAAVVIWLQEDIETKARVRFNRQAELIEADVQQHLKLPFIGLRGAAGVYAASNSVERGEFRAYVQSSKVAAEYPGVRAFGFIQRVNRSGLDQFIAAQHRDDSPGFAVKSSGDAPTLHVIKFLEPAEGNQSAIGLDLTQDPVRMQAIQHAIDTGEETLTGRVQLVQDAAQRPAFEFLLPVYINGSQPVTVAQRQESLDGVLLASVVIEGILSDVAASAQGQVNFGLYDGPVALGQQPENLLFDLNAWHIAAGLAVKSPAGEKRVFETSRTVLLRGRVFTLRISTTPWFEAQIPRSAPVGAGVAGALLSLLLAFSVWLLGSGRVRALALAERMTQDLAGERQRLLNIVEGTNAGSWVWQVQTGELNLDERATAMLGYDLHAMGAQNIAAWGDRMHPDDLRRAKAGLNEHFLGKTPYFECETRLRHKDGQWVWGLVRGKVSAWTTDGKPDVMSGTQMDISDKQAVQVALRSSEEHFRYLFEHSLDGILQALPDGSVLYANPAACRLLGMIEDEIRRRGRSGFTDSQDSRFHIYMAQAVMTGESRGECTMMRRDGSLFDCELSMSNYSSQSGESCTNIFFRDITKRKLAEAEIEDLNRELENRVRRRTRQLEMANKELEAFSYSVAHDLRAPLSSIDGFSHLLLKATLAQDAERSGHYLSRIRASVKQMGDLTDGLLALAHLSRTSLKSERVDLAAMARQILESTRERDPGRVVSVHVEDDLQIVGDAALLRQVMENLIANAWKFTTQVAAPEIRIGKLDDGTESPLYYVRDNGAGFDMAYVDKLFGMFQRLHSPGEFPGTGIGLATSSRIIARHAGRIWATGAVGEGATFFFTVPSRERSEYVTTV